MSANYVIMIFTLFIYVMIIVAFHKASVKCSGGKIGDLINIVLITVILLFIAEYAKVFEPYISITTISTLQTLFRTVALSFLVRRYENCHKTM